MKAAPAFNQAPAQAANLCSIAANPAVRARLDDLLGMSRVTEKFVLILDIDRVLSPEELAAVASVEEPTAGETPVGPPASRELPGATSIRADPAQSRES